MATDTSAKEMKYNKGNPPSIGWWPTGPHKVRWWNGEYWSWTCLDTDSIYWVKHFSAKEAIGDVVVWYPRPENWPERSRT